MTVPNIVLRDLGISPGEKLSIYRGVLSGIPVMVVANSDMPELTAETGLLDTQWDDGLMASDQLYRKYAGGPA
jgi:N-acetylmuramoyl-L-alanine amidase